MNIFVLTTAITNERANYLTYKLIKESKLGR